MITDFDLSAHSVFYADVTFRGLDLCDVSTGLNLDPALRFGGASGLFFLQASR